MGGSVGEGGGRLGGGGGGGGGGVGGPSTGLRVGIGVGRFLLFFETFDDDGRPLPVPAIIAVTAIKVWNESFMMVTLVQT